MTATIERTLSMRSLCWLLLAMCAGGAETLAAERPVPDRAPGPRVISAVGSRADGSAGLGDGLTVQVQGVSAFLDRVGGDCRDVVLFLADAAVPNLPPETCDGRRGTIRFLLDRQPENDANNHAWRRLLGSPEGALRRVSVSVGTPRLLMLPTDVQAFPLFVLSPARLSLFFIVLATETLALIALARCTSLIRRPASRRAGPYSLSRVQMAFWSYLVLAAYVFLWLTAGEVDTITGSVLALLGVNAGTGIAAWMIDSSRDLAPERSRGFFIDILSNGQGLTIHRLQTLVWTLTLGIIFVVMLYRTLFMPQFSPMLLAMLGIGHATYLVMKIPEARRGASADSQITGAPG